MGCMFSNLFQFLFPRGTPWFPSIKDTDSGRSRTPSVSCLHRLARPRTRPRWRRSTRRRRTPDAPVKPASLGLKSPCLKARRPPSPRSKTLKPAPSAFAPTGQAAVGGGARTPARSRWMEPLQPYLKAERPRCRNLTQDQREGAVGRGHDVSRAGVAHAPRSGILLHG